MPTLKITLKVNVYVNGRVPKPIIAKSVKVIYTLKCHAIKKHYVELKDPGTK